MRGHKKNNNIKSLNILYFLLRIYLRNFRCYFIHPKPCVAYLFASLLSCSLEHKDICQHAFHTTQVTLYPSWIIFIVWPWVCLCASFCTFHFQLVSEWFELVSVLALNYRAASYLPHLILCMQHNYWHIVAEP